MDPITVGVLFAFAIVVLALIVSLPRMRSRRNLPHRGSGVSSRAEMADSIAADTARQQSQHHHHQPAPTPQSQHHHHQPAPTSHHFSPPPSHGHF